MRVWPLLYNETGPNNNNLLKRNVFETIALKHTLLLYLLFKKEPTGMCGSKTCFKANEIITNFIQLSSIIEDKKS